MDLGEEGGRQRVWEEWREVRWRKRRGLMQQGGGWVQEEQLDEQQGEEGRTEGVTSSTV